MFPDRHLQWVDRVEVIVEVESLLHAVRHKTRVFAAAVVVPLVYHETFRQRAQSQFGKQWPMATAAQGVVVLAHAGQHALGLRDVHGLSVVTGAHQCKLALAPAQRAGAAGLHEGQRLKRLDGGAGKGEGVRVAHVGKHLPIAVGHRHCAPVLALGQAATGDFDQRHKFHRDS